MTTWLDSGKKTSVTAVPVLTKPETAIAGDAGFHAVGTREKFVGGLTRVRPERGCQFITVSTLH